MWIPKVKRKILNDWEGYILNPRASEKTKKK